MAMGVVQSEDRALLSALIDRYSLNDLRQELVSICCERAQRVMFVDGDKWLSQVWDDAAMALRNAELDGKL